MVPYWHLYSFLFLPFPQNSQRTESPNKIKIPNATKTQSAFPMETYLFDDDKGQKTITSENEGIVLGLKNEKTVIFAKCLGESLFFLLED